MKNQFREWISDNLRYIILGLGILVVIAAIFFGVRFLTSAMDNKEGQVKSEGSQSGEATPTPEATKAPDSSSASSATPTPEADNTVVKDGNAEISALMNNYYAALGAKDITSLQTVVDNLSQEEQDIIMAEANIEGYSDVAAYTFPGQQEGTYVVIASYNCKYKDIDTRAPGLSQMYLYTNTEGKLVIAAQTENEAVNNYMKDLQNQPEVKQLIADTQTAYEAARASDTKLDALITSVSGQ